MNKSEIKLKLCFMLFTIAYLVIVCFCLSGCAITKHKVSKISDSTIVSSRNDVSANELKAGNNDVIEWFKEIYKYPAPKDTVVNKVYPTTVIREYGKYQHRDTIYIKDTSASQAAQVKSVSSEEIKKDMKSKPVNLWILAMIWGGWELLKLVVFFIKSKYSLTIKQ